MSRLTEELIRRKAEHHDGLISDLEEISLHQLELEKIEVIGTLCRKLKILYLQNNIIPAIENLSHCTDLRYLNLALNNVTIIEGLGNCELLEKLDLTVNFIDLDALEASIAHLVPLLHLRDLYLMGNPAAEWPGMRAYIVALLPQLRALDGKDVVRAERITARQSLRENEAELRRLAAEVRARKGLPVAAAAASAADDADENGAEPWSPEARVAMYRELAEQKEEKERRRREMEPPKRDYAAEHAAAVAASKAREAATGVLRQMNEGRWEFTLEDEDGRGNAVLRLSLSRFLDSSLVDVDVHPSHVTVVIRSKTFRILWPAEVLPDRGCVESPHVHTRPFSHPPPPPCSVSLDLRSCQRSQTTGELVVSVLKAVKNPVLQSLRAREGAPGPAPHRAPPAAAAEAAAARDAARTRRAPQDARPPKLADLILQQQHAQVVPRGSSASAAGASPGARTGAPPLPDRRPPVAVEAGVRDDDARPDIPPLE